MSNTLQTGVSNTAPPHRPHQNMSGEGLRNKAQAANLILNRELHRIRSEDERFLKIHDLVIELAEEIRLRKNSK
jgi:hypothetical protein